MYIGFMFLPKNDAEKHQTPAIMWPPASILFPRDHMDKSIANF
jgi:hypothetical protein